MKEPFFLTYLNTAIGSSHAQLQKIANAIGRDMGASREDMQRFREAIEVLPLGDQPAPEQRTEAVARIPTALGVLLISRSETVTQSQARAPLHMTSVASCAREQAEVIDWVARIVEGEDYSGIAGFMEWVKDGRFNTHGKPTLLLERDGNGLQILREQVSPPVVRTFPRVQDTLRTIVCYSLTDFLKNEDRRKLKRCTQCSAFFISKHQSAHVCSDRCRKLRKRRYQRQWMYQHKDDPKYVR